MPKRPTEVDEVAKRLKETRLAAGLTQAAVCRTCGFTSNRYANWEMGLSRPDIDAGKVLSKRLGWTMEWLYPGEPRSLDPELREKIFARVWETQVKRS